METYATGALEVEYNKVIESRVSPDHLRVSEFAVGGGEHQTKDPVYSYISEKTRNEFAPLLHELPLYLSKRSIMLEDEATCQQARLLYRARNNILHKGGLTGTDDASLALDMEGASLGIETALAVCRWFGMGDKYVVPGTDFVELQARKVAPTTTEMGRQAAGLDDYTA